MNRRTLLLALTAAAATPAAAPRALAAGATVAPPPPPPPDDTFGFASTLRAEGVGGPAMRDFSGWVKALKTLGEAPMLTADAADSGPAFRLTLLSAKAPAVTAHVTWGANRQSATAMISYGDVPGMPGQRTRTVRRDYIGPSALNLLDVVDRLETFWDAAPLPPDWAAIQALADCPACAITEPDGDRLLLEGRMGARRHLILRLSPPPSSLIARFAAAVIPAEPKPEPPKPALPPRRPARKPRRRHRPHLRRPPPAKA
ncbi:hypothetical protein ACO2Q3_03570 [Caulobacter sp. KR2-114]|uniref:hypothetical protein n=1 Tax=Caulobacter sp. KR2-114 TaxID=3400912 RepID=UPI003C09BD48